MGISYWLMASSYWLRKRQDVLIEARGRKGVVAVTTRMIAPPPIRQVDDQQPVAVWDSPQILVTNKGVAQVGKGYDRVSM